MRFHEHKLELLGVGALCSLLFVWTLAPLQGYDLWFYLAVARDLVETGSIPWSESYLGTTSVWSFGKYANHAWLSYLSIYLFYLVGGPLGLVVCRSVLLVTVTALTYLNCRLLGLAPWPSALWVSLGLWTVRSRFLLRTYHFTDIMLALLLTVLIYYGQRDSRRTLMLLGLFCLWSNLHQGVIAGWVLIVLWTIGGGMRWKQGFFALVAAVIGTHLRPYGWTFPQFLYDHFANESAMTGVIEWAPLSLDAVATHLGPFLILTVLLAGLGWRQKEWPQKIPWHYLLVSAAFIVLAIRSQRAVAEILPVAFPLLVVFFPKEMNSIKLRTVAVVALLSLMIYTNPPTDYRRVSSLYPHYPVKLTDVLKGRPGQVFNSYEWGGYLTFEKLPPFIHGTTALFEQRLVDDFQTMLNASDHGVELFDEYEVTNILLHYPTEEDATELLIAYLDSGPKWKLDTWDDSGMLFSRQPESRDLVAVKPWTKPSWDDPEAARLELEALLESHPSARAHLMLSELASYQDQWELSATQARLALEIMPHAYHGWQALSAAALRLGDEETMKTASKNAVRYGKDRSRAHFNRALILLHDLDSLGTLQAWWARRSARRHLEKALELEPGLHAAREILNSLK